jgi:signal transduction histidine kinase
MRADIATRQAIVQDAVLDRPRALRLVTDGRVRYVLGVTLLAALYAGAGYISFELRFAGPVAAVVWLPVGVGIAFLYLGGIRFWPGLLIGDLLVNDYSAIPFGSALGQTCGNILEVVVATLAIRLLVRRRPPLEDVGDLGRLLFAIAAGAAVSATVGTASLWLGDVLSVEAWPTVWRTWWLGDYAGAVVIVPLAMAWSSRPSRALPARRWLEGALMLGCVAMLSAFPSRNHRPLTYVVFPILIWAALRFGPRGATLAVAVCTGFTLWDTTHYGGPFAYHSITHSVLSTQLFVIVAGLSTLYLAAVVRENERFSRELGASRARIVKAAQAERRRLEHNLHDGAQQRLTWLAVDMRRGAEQARASPERAAALFERAEVELELAIEELRDLARGIHPSVLTDLGLATAIRGAALRSTIPITLLELPELRLDDNSEATSFYVFAEAVTNVQRHAGASKISVRAAFVDGRLHIEVVDDGVGGADPLGSGLQGLRDRVETAGGTFRVESGPGRGTRVAATIPAALAVR